MRATLYIDLAISLGLALSGLVLAAPLVVEQLKVKALAPLITSLRPHLPILGGVCVGGGVLGLLVSSLWLLLTLAFGREEEGLFRIFIMLARLGGSAVTILAGALVFVRAQRVKEAKERADARAEQAAASEVHAQAIKDPGARKLAIAQLGAQSAADAQRTEHEGDPLSIGLGLGAMALGLVLFFLLRLG